jgi:hypothetical protein
MLRGGQNFDLDMSRTFRTRLFTIVAGIGTGPNEDDDSLRRMVFIWASLAVVPCLAIYCAVYIFLGAPLAAVIMFAYVLLVGVYLFFPKANCGERVAGGTK